MRLRSVQGALEEVGSCQALILLLNPEDEEVRQSAEILYREAVAHGLSVFMDDRQESANLKRSEAPLTKPKVILEVGSQDLLSGSVHLIVVDGKRALQVALEDAVDKTVELVREFNQCS
jgi:threonyl-tRNA synthetase